MNKGNDLTQTQLSNTETLYRRLAAQEVYINRICAWKMGIRKPPEFSGLKVCEEQYEVQITTSYWSHSSKLRMMLLLSNLFIAHLDDRKWWIISKFANNAKLVEVIHRLMDRTIIQDWHKLEKGCTCVLGGTRKAEICGFIQFKVEKTRGVDLIAFYNHLIERYSEESPKVFWEMYSNSCANRHNLHKGRSLWCTVMYRVCTLLIFN